MTITNEQILSQFAQEVGNDYKQLNGKINQLSSSQQQAINQAIAQAKAEINQSIQTAKQQVKDDILGGASEEVDTLKEIAEKLATSGQDTNAIVIQKIAEQNQRITAIENTLNVDLLQIYNIAKG